MEEHYDTTEIKHEHMRDELSAFNFVIDENTINNGTQEIQCLPRW